MDYGVPYEIHSSFWAGFCSELLEPSEQPDMINARYDD